MEHTRASFVLGHHQEQASVVCCQRGDTTLLVTDLTPFHPQSHLWPDQPGDVGHVRWEGGEAAIRPCRMGAISPDGELFVDTAIPVKRGAEGWRFVVVHPLTGDHALAVGSQVELQVDSTSRHALSLGHSGCHLAALALNRVLIPYWRKEVSERDALDQPDFDRLAIQSSRVEPMGSREQYRIGKSLRKKGVNSEALLADLALIEEQVNQQLADWIAAGRDPPQPRWRGHHRLALLALHAGRSGGDHPLWRHPCRIARRVGRGQGTAHSGGRGLCHADPGHTNRRLSRRLHHPGCTTRVGN